MAIYGIGAYVDKIDVSSELIKKNIVGIGHSNKEAPDLFEFIKTLKVGDIVYIKSAPIRNDFKVKAIGIICSSKIKTDTKLKQVTISIAREVKWIKQKEFVLKRGKEKFIVKGFSLFEEFNPLAQKQIIDELIKP